MKKFLQTVHSRLEVGQGETKKPLLMAPDFLIECDDFLFQIYDDPFEVKLRANYEVQCHERTMFDLRGGWVVWVISGCYSVERADRQWI